ncbi:MAG TPA: gamma subclass chorismate mutase AroQ [Trebonia sp.]
MPARESVTSSAYGVSDAVSLDAIVVLIAKRLALAADVAAAKFIGGGQVDDPAREEQILDWVADRLPDGRVGRETGISFFHDQIAANKVIQRGLHSHWRANPGDSPRQWHGLSGEIRPRLNVINRHMLLLLPDVACLPPDQLTAVNDRLDATLAANPALRQLGDSRREAARIAVRSLRCAG